MTVRPARLKPIDPKDANAMSPEETARLQRILTVQFVQKRRLNIPVIWLRANSDAPEAKDALSETLDTDIETWDGPERNLGARLENGYFELRIKAGGDGFAHAFFLACEHLRIDARAAFGVDRISSIILRVERQAEIEQWLHLWPKGFKDKHGHWTETTAVTSSLATKNARAVPRESKPLPGSVLPEGVVVWRPNGKAAALNVEFGLEELEPRTIAPSTIPEIIRALAYATVAYWVRTYLDGLTDWDTILTGRMGGFIARLVVEGAAINAQGKSLEGVCWSPIDSAEHALNLIAFLGRLGASADLKIAYLRGEAALARAQNAKVAGWSAIEETFGVQGKIGIRRAMKAGLDIDIIEKMSERFILDLSTGGYVDRDAIHAGLIFEKSHDELIRRHENEVVMVGRKRYNAFRLYAASSLRTDVAKSDMYPGREPGAILRVSPVYGLLSDVDWQADEYRALNTYRGFTIKPVGVVDPGVMAKVISMLDRMLGLLTRDNTSQMAWLKKFIAWTIQHPEIKQQVAPVIIGGQGIGKSLFGVNLMRALFGSLAGTATASALSDNNFSITPFIGKLMSFVDEVRLESVGAINEIKKIVRQITISGQVKFGHQQDYEIYSRLILAANQTDIGLTPEDAADRALYFIVSYTAENMHLSARHFQEWAQGLKPFYSEFVTALETVPVRQHLMSYFRSLECNREELEDLTTSSRDDENVIKSTMSKAREVARRIAAEGRILAGNDLTAWFTFHHLRSAVLREDGQRSRVEPEAVLKEFESAGVLEPAREGRGGYFKFKWGYGKTLQEMGKAHNLELLPVWPTGPGDFDDNPIMSPVNPPPWRGNPKGDNRRRPFEPGERDPDYLQPE